MPTLQAEQIVDIVATTLKTMHKLRFTDLSTDLQEYYAMRIMMQGDKVVTYDDGYAFQWDVLTDTDDSAEFVGLYHEDHVDVTDAMVQASSTWKHITWNWAFDYHEQAFNGGASRIVNLIDTRRIRSMIGAIQKFERAMWRCPSASTTKEPFGIPYSVVKNNVTGFNGGLPTGYTDVYGLSPTTYPRWKNFTAQYTSITKDDLIDKMAQAADKTKFTPPVDGLPLINEGMSRGIYTNYNVYRPLKQILEAQNENLGLDVDWAEGKAVFRRTPFNWVPQLDEDTDDPVYMIDWKSFKTAKLKGWWNRMTEIAKHALMHNVYVCHYDSSFNWLNFDRRRHAVIAKNTTGGVA